MHFNLMCNLDVFEDVAITIKDTFLKKKLHDGSFEVYKIKNKNEHERFGFDMMQKVGPF